MLSLWVTVWVILFRLISSPFHAFRLVSIQHFYREAAQAEVSLVSNIVWMHKQDVQALRKLEEQAAEEADLLLLAGKQVLLQLTRSRMDEILIARKSMLAQKELFPSGGHITKTTLPCSGPPQFVEAVNTVLSELYERAPHRYREVLEFLPKAVYDRSILSIPAHGRSDGLFSIDGSNYEYFRFVFLHEVGRNVHGKREGVWTEKAATDYANKVLEEIR